MKKPSDFSKLLTGFFLDYLTIQKNVSRNTIKSYRDTFKLLLQYFETEGLSADKITMQKLSAEQIRKFLSWLETERNCSVSTRNLRLAALHSFFRYAQIESPQNLFYYQQVLAIPSKRAPKRTIPLLSPEAIQILLEQPDRTTVKGRRDLTLLSTMYDSGARVREVISLSVKDFISAGGPILVLSGKGNKIRRVPIMKNTARLLERYICEHHLMEPGKRDYPLFTNQQHNRLTKEGVAYILKKYSALANAVSSEVPEKMNCHMLRHSKAIHLLRAGVNLVYIRDFLGHSDIKTTEIYARADTEIKRRALEKAYPDLMNSNLPDWGENRDLMKWLADL